MVFKRKEKEESKEIVKVEVKKESSTINNEYVEGSLNYKKDKITVQK